MTNTAADDSIPIYRGHYYLVIMSTATDQFMNQFASTAAYDKWNGTNGTVGYSWLDDGWPEEPAGGASLETNLNDDVTAAAAATPHVAVPMNPLSVQPRGSNSPTELDMRGWSMIRHLYVWAGFKARDDALVASLLEMCNLQPEDPIRDFAVIDPMDFAADLQEWNCGERRVASGDKGKAREMMHAARVKEKLEDPRDVALFKIETDKRKQQELEWMIASSGKGKSARTNEHSSSSNASPDIPLHRRVCVRDIADDLSSQEIIVMEQKDLAPLLKNWREEHNNTKRDPPPDHEPSKAQLSYLGMCKETGEIPYVNLGFWGPFQDRIYQRILTYMWVFMSDGQKVRQKFLGPPTIKQWLVCWAVYACGMIMHKLPRRKLWMIIATS